MESEESWLTILRHLTKQGFLVTSHSRTMGEITIKVRPLD